MSATTSLVLWAISNALTPGPEFEPALLMAIAAKFANPIAALSDLDKGNELFGAVEEELGFLNVLRQNGKAATEEERHRLVNLLRWTIRSFHEWQIDRDPNSQLLVSLFVITRTCERAEDQFWKHMSESAANEALRDRLVDLANGMQINLGTSSFSPRPISDREAVQKLVRADEKGEWAELEQQLSLISTHMLPATFLSQLVGYLKRLYPDSLVRASSAVHQTLVALQLLSPLSNTEKIDLALACNNPYVELAAFHVCASARAGGVSATPDLNALLSKLLVKVSNDSPRWAQWMEAFARFPARYRRIAVPMGEALSQVSDDAVRAYVNSIVLTRARNPGREAVADTLRVFRAAASEDRQKLLWKLSQDRWKEWNFGGKSEGLPMTGIAHCELDYALVGFAAVCISGEERQQQSIDARRRLSTLDLQWFSSLADCSHEKYRLLSIVQPLLHAMNPRNDWLAKVDYLPFEKEDRYAKLFLGVGFEDVRAAPD